MRRVKLCVIDEELINCNPKKVSIDYSGPVQLLTTHEEVPEVLQYFSHIPPFHVVVPG